MGVALGAETDDGAGLAFEDVEIGVLVGINFSGRRICEGRVSLCEMA